MTPAQIAIVEAILEYAEDFASLNEEPQGGDCGASIQAAKLMLATERAPKQEADTPEPALMVTGAFTESGEAIGLLMHLGDEDNTARAIDALDRIATRARKAIAALDTQPAGKWAEQGVYELPTPFPA